MQDSSKPFPYFWATRLCSTPIPVNIGKNCPDSSPSQATCEIFVKARDTAGNVGTPTSASYGVSLISTDIVSPRTGDTKGANFNISVADEDLSGTELRCYYRVISNGVTILDWRERTCNGNQAIPVKEDGCIDNGKDVCEIQAYAENVHTLKADMATTKEALAEAFHKVAREIPLI